MSIHYPTYFVSHGGGPCFWMDWNPPELFDGLRAFFEELPRRLPRRPSAIVVISAHWEEAVFTVQSTANPAMIYDYSGFPPHTYQLQYPAKGDPDLAKRISALLNAQAIECRLDSSRGYDHGVYVPLLIAFPQADVPVIQISLRSDLSPAQHLRLGEALRPLREENVLIVGSGFSYHNLRAIPDRIGASEVFDKWLFESLCVSSPEKRHERLLRWSEAPAARAAHPREEHLIPLMVCAGAAAGGACERVFSQKLPAWNIQTCCFEFQ
ncbi:MAG: dioxygenase extradiol [Pseudomonadota bacterium]